MDFNAPGIPDGMAQLLARKYALLQQQADAGTVTAKAQANSANAAAGLDTVRTKLLPTESAANVGLTNAQAGATTAQGNLANVQADWYGPEANSRIAQNNAGAYYTGLQGDVLKRNNFTPIFGSAGAQRTALSGVMGGAMPSLPTTARPTRLPNESQSAYMDRTGWGPDGTF